MRKQLPTLPPEQLFRRALEWRPREPIAFRFDVAPDVPLFVQAAPSAELARARSEQALLCLVLVDAQGVPVVDADALGMLSRAEYARAEEEAVLALPGVSPTFGTVDRMAWSHALEKGAGMNYALARQVYACHDVTPGGSLRERPDLFFGQPMSQILDAHLMAFEAVRSLVEKQRVRPIGRMP